MLKKTLYMKAAALGLVASSSLLFGTFAFANNSMNPSSDDPFVTQSQSGPAVSANTVSSFADTAGIYAQLEGYYTSSQQLTNQTLDASKLVHDYDTKAKAGTGYSAATLTNKKAHGFGGRLSVGYDLSHWFGVEVGFLMNPKLNASLKDMKDNSKATAPVAGKTPSVPGGVTIKDTPDIAKLSSYGVDILAKARVPLTQSIYAFAGAGAVWMHNKIEGTSEYTKYIAGKKLNIAWNKIAPEVEAGLGIGLSKNIAVDVAYRRIFGSDLDTIYKDVSTKKKPDVVLTQNIVSLGVVYKFPL